MEKQVDADIINPEDSSVSGIHMIGGGDMQTAQYASSDDQNLDDGEENEKKIEKKSSILNKIAIGLTDVPSAGVPQNPGLSRDSGDGEGVDFFGARSEIVDKHPINYKYEKYVNNSSLDEESYFSYLYDLDHDQNIGILNDLKDTFYYSRAGMYKSELKKLAKIIKNKKVSNKIMKIADDLLENNVDEAGKFHGDWQKSNKSEHLESGGSALLLRDYVNKSLINERVDNIYKGWKDLWDKGFFAEYKGSGVDPRQAFSSWAFSELGKAGFDLIKPINYSDVSKVRGTLLNAIQRAVADFKGTPSESPSASARKTTWDDGGTGFARYYKDFMAGKKMMDAWLAGKPDAYSSDVRGYMKWLRDSGIKDYSKAINALTKTTTPSLDLPDIPEESTAKKEPDAVDLQAMREDSVGGKFEEYMDFISIAYAKYVLKEIKDNLPGKTPDVYSLANDIETWILRNFDFAEIADLIKIVKSKSLENIDMIKNNSLESIKRIAFKAKMNLDNKNNIKEQRTRTVDLSTLEGQKRYVQSFMSTLRKDPSKIDVKGRIGEGRATRARVRWLLTKGKMTYDELTDEVVSRGGRMLNQKMVVDTIKQLVREQRRGKKNSVEDSVNLETNARQRNILKLLKK